VFSDGLCAAGATKTGLNDLPSNGHRVRGFDLNEVKLWQNLKDSLKSHGA